MHHDAEDITRLNFMRTAFPDNHTSQKFLLLSVLYVDS